VESKDRQRIIRALRDVVIAQRDQDVPTVLAAVRAELDALDRLDPPKAERKTRETRDRQETAGRDRGTA
jgi:hypothetical protein